MSRRWPWGSDTDSDDLSVAVSVGMEFSRTEWALLILASPLWLPGVAISDMHSRLSRCKSRYRYWKNRHIRQRYYETRDSPESEPRELYPLVSAIESQTGRKVTIESTTSEQNLARCNAQEQSPLFALPAEIRNLIFDMAVAERPTKRNTEFPLPTSKPACGVNLLLTCRRAWLEANVDKKQIPGKVIWLVDPYAGVFADPKEVGITFQRLFANSPEGLRIVVPLSWTSWSPITSLVQRAHVKWPSVLNITVWHVGGGSSTMWLTASDNLEFLLYAKEAGTRRVNLEFVTKTSLERLNVDYTLRRHAQPQGNYTFGWRCCQEQDWEVMHIGEGDTKCEYLIKRIGWETTASTGRRGHGMFQHAWAPPFQWPGYRDVATPHEDCDAVMVKMESTEAWEARWHQERSLLKFTNDT